MDSPFKNNYIVAESLFIGVNITNFCMSVCLLDDFNIYDGFGKYLSSTESSSDYLVTLENSNNNTLIFSAMVFLNYLDIFILYDTET